MLDRENLTDMLERITKEKEMNYEDLETMQSTFRQEFTSAENKIEVLQLIQEVLSKYELNKREDYGSDDENDKENPAANLKNEFNRAMSSFKQNFSLFRAAGLEDPDDVKKNISVSDDKSMDWDEQDDDMMTDFNLTNKEKAIFSKNFAKLVKMGLEKKNLFEKTIHQWKYKALEHKMKKQNLLSRTLFMFNRRMDHKVARAFGVLRLNNRINGMKEPSKPNDTYKPPKPSFERKPVEVKSNLPPLPPKKVDGVKEGLIGAPTRTLEKAIENHILNTQINKDLKSNEFSNLNKARFMRKVLENFQKKNKDFAFYTLLNVNAKRIKALQEVSNRIKGKLIMAMHKNFSGDQVKSSYYKWYVKSNPDLLKKLASNMLIKLQLSNQVAGWRLISLVRTHKQRDERAIMLKLAKGLMNLMSMTKIHQLQEARNAMQRMNPNHYTKKTKLLEKSLIRLLRSNAIKAGDAFNTLRRRPLVVQKALRRVGNNIKKLKEGALNKLRVNRLNKDERNKLRGVEKLVSLFNNRQKAYNRAFVDHMKKKLAKGNDLMKKLMDKLGISKRKAFNNLRRMKNKAQHEEFVQGMSNNMNGLKKKLLLKQLGEGARKSKRGVISALKRKVQEKLKKEQGEKQKSDSLAKFLSNSTTGKLYSALQKLKQNKNRGVQTERTKNASLRMFTLKSNDKLLRALKSLRNFNRDKDDEARLKLSRGEMLARRLMNAAQRKQERAIADLMKRLNDAKNKKELDDQKLKQMFAGRGLRTKRDLREVLENLRSNKRTKDLEEMKGNALVKKLTNSNLNKLSNALRKLRSQGMISESNDQRQNRILRFLMKGPKNKLRFAMSKLMMHKNKQNVLENESERCRKGMLLGMIGNMNEKKRLALELLRNLKNSNKNKEELQAKDKTSLLKLFGARSKVLKERLLRSMNKFTNSVADKEKATEMKKSGLSGLMFAKANDKLRLAYFRLIFFRHQNEKEENKKNDLLKQLGEKMNELRRSVINKMKGKATEESNKEMEKQRNGRLILNHLRDKTKGKLVNALLKLLRNKAEGKKDEEEKTALKNELVKKLKLKGSDIYRKVLDKLRNFTRDQQEEEGNTHQNMRYLAGLLSKNYDVKKHMAFLKLIKNTNKVNQSNQKKNNIMRTFARKVQINRNSTLWKLLSKGQAEEMKETQRVLVKSNLLRKIGDTGRAKMADALHRLMINRLQGQFEGENKKKLNLALLTLMKNNARLSAQRALLRLMAFKEENEKHEQKNHANVKGLLEKFHSKCQRLKFSVYHKLKDFRREQLKKFDAQKYLLETMCMKNARARDRLIFNLLNNNKDKQTEESLKQLEKKKLLGSLFLKGKNKLDHAFFKLAVFGLKSGKQDQVRNLVENRLLNKLHLSGSNLVRDAFFKLWTFKNKTNNKENDQNKIMKILMKTQTMRLREALLKLRAIPDKNDVILLDPEKRRNVIGLLLGLNNKNRLLMKRVLNRLRFHKDRAEEEEKLKGGNRWDPDRLANELAKRLNNPKPTGQERRFNELANYLRRNPKEGKNAELYDALQNGDIKNMEDLYKYMDDHGKKGEFDNVKDLLNNPNMVVQLARKLLPSYNKNGECSNAMKLIDENPNLPLNQTLANLQRTNKDGSNKAPLQALKGAKDGNKAIDFMKDNNDDGKYNKVLKLFKNTESPKLSTLLAVLADPRMGNPEDLQKVIDFIDKKDESSPTEEILSNLINSHPDGIENPLAQNLINSDKPSLLDFAKKMKNELNKPSNKEVKDAINGKDEPILDDVIQRVAVFNEPNEWLSPELEELKNSKKYSDAAKANKLKKDDSPQKTFLYNLLGNRKMYEDMLEFMDNQEDLRPLKEKLEGLKSGPITTNDELLYRAYLLELEDPEDEFSDSLDIFWEIAEKLLPAEKLLDQLRSSSNPAKYSHIMKLNKKADGGFELDGLYNAMKRNRLINDEVKGFINEDTKDTSKIAPITLLRNYLSEIPNKNNSLAQLEAKLLRPENTNAPLTSILDQILDANKNGDVQNVLDFVDYGFKETELDKLKRFVNENVDNEPDLQKLKDLLDKNPSLELMDVLETINEEPEEYGARIIDQYLNGDVDRPAGALGVMNWANKNNDEGDLDDVVEGIQEKLDDEGKDLLSELTDRTYKGNKNGKLRKALDNLNQKDFNNGLEDMMRYIRKNNDDGKYDDILNRMEDEEHPDLETLGNILSSMKGNKDAEKLLDLFNGKTLSNQDLLDWLKNNNADGRYDDLIAALEANPNMNRDELMKMIRELNPNGEMDDLLGFINSEGHAAEKSAEDALLDYLAKYKDDPRFKDAFDYLDEHGLKDPKAFLEYLESINHDGRYDEMINKLKNMIGEQDKENEGKSIYDMKLFKPLKGLLKMYLQKLRDWNKDAAILEEKNNGQMNKMVLKLNFSNDNKLRAAFNLLRELRRAEAAKKLNTDKKVLKALNFMSESKKGNDRRGLVRAMFALIDNRNRELLMRIMCRRIQQASERKLEDSVRSLRIISKPFKKKMELLTMLLQRSLKQKQSDCLKGLIDFNKTNKKMNMQLRLSNLYWNLRRNHLKEKRHAFNIWSQKSFKNKMNDVANRLKKFIEKKKLKSYNHQKQLYFETKYKKLLDGNDQLSKFLQEKDIEHKQTIVESIFERKNPWIGRILETLTRKVQINEQILLWRLVDEMNIEKISSARTTALRNTILRQM